MLKIFTTPNLMQRYLADPITYRFTSRIKEIYPNPIIAEDYDCTYICKDDRVVNALRKIMKSYKGFKFRRNGNSYIWYHPMKASSNYVGNMLVISLSDAGSGMYRFSTHIVMGKKKRDCYVMTAFGYIAGLCALLIVGLAGVLEHDLLAIPQFLICSVICAGVGILAGFIEYKINPVFDPEEESN